MTMINLKKLEENVIQQHREKQWGHKMQGLWPR